MSHVWFYPLPLDGSGHGVDLDLRLAAPGGGADEDVVLEHSAGEVRFGVCRAVESVKHLHVFLPQEKVFRQRSLDGIQKRLPVVGVNFFRGITQSSW